MGNSTKINPIYSNFLLDEARSPVARFRLLSDGVNTNTRLMDSDQIAGDCACLACGNCVDACPVVKHNVGRVFIQNMRTSMSLENFVQEECRRCYRCVNSCPQVSKELKEYASGYRRVEKIVHLLAACIIILLAATGVTRSHYGNVLGGFESDLLKYAHRTLGVVSLLIPIIYYKMDIGHFRRTLHKIFSWGTSDRLWFKDTFAHIFTPKSGKPIVRHEFNPIQKIWYLFIMSFFPLLYLSGWGAMLFGSPAAGQQGDGVRMVHMGFALCFDIMLFIHVYIKFIREWIGNGYQLYRNYKVHKSLIFKGN
jgi:cytochrome b subunit of formate dehydrogenase/succinate dehydrogenase/fumarate reductase-like Fe-S protein